MPTEKNIKSPEELWGYFEQYQEWAKANPRKENIPDFKGATSFKVDRERPLTFKGFEKWLRGKKIVAKLDDYKSNKDNRYAEYAGIVRDIQDECDLDQYEGAAVGIFKENLVARKLGLADKNNTEHSGGMKIESKIIVNNTGSGITKDSEANV